MQTIPWPFIATEALAANALTFRELRRFHSAVYPGVWAPRGVEISAIDRARAAWLWSGRRGVVAGLSASAVLGAKWIDTDTPAELVYSNRRPPARITAYDDTLLPGEVHAIAGLPVTVPARTAFDIGRRLDFTAAVQRIDALMNAPGVRGLRQLRRALEVVDGGSESPYESLPRLLLIRNGFPRPQTQIRVIDDDGFVVARLDMGWPEWRVDVDFDGAHHWTDPRQRSRDIERYAKLPELGWADIRVSGDMLHNNPQVVLERVGAALLARGCSRTW